MIEELRKPLFESSGYLYVLRYVLEDLDKLYIRILQHLHS
jgi:hypothetical protein